jgi:hypothetical protein
LDTGKSCDHGISRRDFARSAALAAATAACLPTDLLAAPALSALAPPQQADDKLSPESQAEVDAKVQAVFSKYGNRLSEAQKADIRRLLTEGQKGLDAMRKFPLDNTDQPGNVMKIYPDATATSGVNSH